MMTPIKLGLLSCLLLPLLSCGSNFDPDEAARVAAQNVNFDKLVGTPFEGKEVGTAGDIGYPKMFLCGKYATASITEFPIKIFTAFFTAADEKLIAEGVEIANTAIGFKAYELTDTWSDDVRVIYKVTSGYILTFHPNGQPNGVTFGLWADFNGSRLSAIVEADWAIIITYVIDLELVVAHELGHAAGILEHKLIDYENNTLIDLEEDSVMGAPKGSELGDYTFMMQKQGELMQKHLGETGPLIDTSWCENL